MNALALPVRIADIIAEYDEKNAGIEAAIKTAEQALDSMKMAATVQGFYAGSIVYPSPNFFPHDLRKKLLKSAWKCVYGKLEIARVASAKDKGAFDRALEDPAPFTIDNIRATFGDYVTRPRFHVLRGLAEQFASLDPAYRSHSNVKIGVKGLPKRIILSGFGEYGYGNGYDKIRDVLNALAAYQEMPQVEHYELSLMKEDFHASGECDLRVSRTRIVKGYPKDEEQYIQPRGVLIRRFQNGNGHVFFDYLTLFDINKALAEFYGDVLPDVEPDSPVAKRATTDVSKDLAYYPTPKKVVDAILAEAGVCSINEWYKGPVLRILEPSCGCGRILDGIRAKGHRGLGYEVHAGRAAEARAKGHSVITGNVLDVAPSPEFDCVIMNPPFAGKHYLKHVRHALKFLKPGGRLVTVLPSTAWYDHKELKGYWTDLPVASFAESGTNVPTGYLVIRPIL